MQHLVGCYVARQARPMTYFVFIGSDFRFPAALRRDPLALRTLTSPPVARRATRLRRNFLRFSISASLTIRTLSPVRLK